MSTRIWAIIIIYTFIVSAKCSIISQRNHPDSLSRIYGGNPVRNSLPNDRLYPYMASLEHHGGHICGAVIIKAYAVITAAHCVFGLQRNQLQIRAGGIKKESTEKDVQVRDISFYTINEKYNQATRRDNDIAVIILKSPFLLGRYVNIIKMASGKQRDQLMGHKVHILGWGRTENNDRSQTLLRASAKLMTFGECKAEMRSFVLSKTMICVIGKKKNTGLGSADSGGPLVHIYGDGNTILLGLASFIFLIGDTKATDTSRPSVFTDVTEVKSWIKDNIKQK